MARSSRPSRLLSVALLALLALPLVAFTLPQAQAAAACAQAKSGRADGVPQWLEGCGRVDLSGTPEQIARRALQARAPALGLSSVDTELALLAVGESPAATHVRFAQRHKGVPVYLGQLLVQYGPDGAVQLIHNRTSPNLKVDVAPAVDRAAATATARARVAGSDRLRAPTRQELVVYAEGKRPELAWHTVLYTQSPPGDWHVMVSAESGAVLGAWDEIWGATGTGQAYVPNPVQELGDPGLGDNNDAASAALDSARTAVTLQNLDPATNQLKGSYVDTTGVGVNGCDLPYTPGLANEPSRAYNYSRDDDRFEEVSVYYAIDGVQSWFQSLGFTNVNNRPIPVDVHCTSIDNSYYSSQDKALHFGDGGVDDAEDSDIVIHEYGHSVHDNQVPGWGPSQNTEQRAMGEAFSDFLAGMYYVSEGNPAFLAGYKYCIGDWDAAGYNPVDPGNSGSGCLRWIDGRDEGDGSDIGVYSGSPTQEHSDGRFWSATLTCVYEGMGATAAARNNVMRLVLQHHFSLLPDNSNQAFETAVDALLLADTNLFGRANRGLINSCALARNVIEASKLDAPTITSPAEGAEVAGGQPLTISWDGAGAPASATFLIEYAVCEDTISFSDDIENGANGWTVSHSGGVGDWAQVTTAAHSPTHSWFAASNEAVNQQNLVSPPLALAGNRELRFWHRYDMELEYDGGMIQISTDDGASWSGLAAQMRSNGYNGTLDAGNPLGGEAAFTGDSNGWIETRVDLTPFAGQTVRLRFAQADDGSVADQGWHVDDISLGSAIAWTPITTTAPGATSHNWTAPAEAGTYCLRVRAQAAGYIASDYSVVRSFQVQAGSPPTISSIADQTAAAGDPIPPIAFTVGDAETPAAELTVTGSSSNPVLLPDAGITIGGSGASRTATLSPAAGLSGVATITLTVSDGEDSASTSFELTVTGDPANEAPTVGAVAAQTVFIGDAVPVISLTVGDAETAVGDLVVVATSSNRALLRNADIAVGGSGAARTLTLSPQPDVAGATTVTVTVSDGEKTTTTSFVLTVRLRAVYLPLIQR